VERGGRGILRLQPLEGDELEEAIAELVDATREGVVPKLGIERVDGEAVIGSGLEDTLIAAGFSRQPRKLVASA
jgi:ATP-dependent helicase Lhr and Lhr-like helicase